MPLAPLIHLGEVLPTDPRQLAPGTPFGMLTLDGSNVLHLDPASPFRNEPPLAGRRGDYIAYLLGNGIVVVNDGNSPGYPDSFARPGYPLTLILRRKRLELDITANDQARDCEDPLFNFTGTEFTSSGLQLGDHITSVTLTSNGASADAGGTFGIVPSNAVVVPADKYDVTYNNGLFTVTCCPWGGAASIPIKYTVDYSEQTSPTNAVKAPTFVESRDWSRHATLDSDETSSPAIGDNFGFGSSGQGTAHVTVQRIPGPSIRVTATLTALGTPWDNLSGDPATKVITLSCSDFLLGHAASFTWTAQYFGGHVIGLVTVYSVSIKYGIF